MLLPNPLEDRTLHSNGFWEPIENSLWGEGFGASLQRWRTTLRKVPSPHDQWILSGLTWGHPSSFTESLGYGIRGHFYCPLCCSWDIPNLQCLYLISFWHLTSFWIFFCNILGPVTLHVFLFLLTFISIVRMELGVSGHQPGTFPGTFSRGECSQSLNNQGDGCWPPCICAAEASTMSTAL